MSNSNIVRELEDNISKAKEMVDMGKTLERLSNNKDFKDIISKGYFEKEAIRLVHLKADPNMQTPERQANVIQQIDAIGALSSYLNMVFFNADRAAQTIDADQLTISELLEGGE